MSSEHSFDVAPLDGSEFGRAGGVFGRAFQDDPLWKTIIPDSSRRGPMLVEMFTALVRTTVAGRGLAEKTPDLGGVALWLPPGRNTGVWAMVKAGFAMPRFVMRLPKSDRALMMAVLRQVEKRREALMPEPHWYIPAIGVDPESQGKGLGSGLMNHGISRADHDGAAVYLETETESNVGFYQNLGFDVIEEFTPEGVDIPMWLMARASSAT